MPRPSIISERHVAEVRALVASGLSFDAVAARLRVGRSTLFEWLKRADEEDDDASLYARFAAEVREGEADFEAKMVANVTGESGKKGEWGRFSWMLERRFPSRYGAKQKIEHSGADGGAIQIDDARARLLDLLSRRAPDSGAGEGGSPAPTG